MDYILGVPGSSPATWQTFDVHAAADGIAMQSVQRDFNGVEIGYGRFVLIRHNEKDESGRHYFTLYAHLQSVVNRIPELPKDDANFGEWIAVSRGENIGKVGDSGAPGIMHLHFEVNRGAYAQNKIDPYDIENSREFYEDAVVCNNAGPDFLWTDCPPIPPGLALDDNFNDNSLNLTIWEPYVIPTPSAGTVTETNQRLEIAMNAGAVNAGLRSRCFVDGDFDVQVDFTLLNWPSNSRQGFSLGALDLGQGSFGIFRAERFNDVGGDAYHMVSPDSVGGLTVSTADTLGKLRMVRTGAILSGYYYNGSSFVFLNSAPVSTSPTRIGLNGGLFRADASAASFAFDNLKVNAGTVDCP